MPQQAQWNAPPQLIGAAETASTLEPLPPGTVQGALVRLLTILAWIALWLGAPRKALEGLQVEVFRP